MPVLAEMLGTDVSKLILRLDVVDTDSSFLDYLLIVSGRRRSAKQRVSLAGYKYGCRRREESRSCRCTPVHCRSACRIPAPSSYCSKTLPPSLSKWRPRALPPLSIVPSALAAPP